MSFRPLSPPESPTANNSNNHNQSMSRSSESDLSVDTDIIIGHLDPNFGSETRIENPKTPSSHQRNASSYSRNYSLLDFYGLESPSGDRESEPLIDASIMKGLDDLEFKELSHANTIFAKSVVPSPETEASVRENYIQPTVSENIEKILNSPYDRYGFRKSSTLHNITHDHYNEWFSDYSQYALRRKKKWHILMKNNGLHLEQEDSIPTRFPPKSDKVKKLIRQGIPAEWRGSAWFFYAGGHERLNKHIGVYSQIVRDTRDIHNKDTEVIERDLHRTFPDNIYFNSQITSPVNSSSTTLATDTSAAPPETPMIKSLRRVLTAFAHYQPQIGYCQSLNFLAGLLLLFMEEERAFWMLVILTERIIPKVHSANLEGVHTDQGVLMLCIKEYIPQLWAILGKNFEGEALSEDKILTRLPPVTLVTSSWFMSLFVGILPIETTLRVWDILWYESSKTIFRFSLTICKMCLENPDFQASRNNNKGGAEMDQIELFQFLQNFPKTILDPNLLVDNCFKKIGGYGFGSLSQDEINKCREFVSKQRAKLDHKKNNNIAAEMTDEERRTLISSSDGTFADDQSIHDVYGFHRSIMSGVIWNKSISNKMKRSFVKRKTSR
ncbi:rab-GTPase-TBC domain-containing protein [Scheffersomyces xylosifermentans]|uniref:rab-GTPase-TBC domain-containing protein n=1 Tax=Scheffersomyces xylosifermentans TaxID=1304137 RepID=UPI00315DA8B3